ncbi:MAG: histidine--tRNA ligase [Candidatus Gastranaerophilales bacterium]|nr:histidine--tRNA ligase [Candidatus Gastranaerophilales bacterium]
MAIKAQKGTKDILPQDSFKWQIMEDTAKNLFKNANCKEIRTPIFEATELFSRGVGDSTDIVNKEMYTFIQKERSITLRPENTAGVVRAYIENGMHRISAPVKLWYKGPMFRYERPQAGRQRQFHQIGLEIFGIEQATADAEAILLAMNYLKALNIAKLSLEINSLGCPDCRMVYRDNIKAVLADKLEEFCPDCHTRYEKNPLRILDCKNPKCQELLEDTKVQEVINADYICESCVSHFEELKSYLDLLNIEYSVSKLLVRGLDYYNRTVFEIKSNALGSQNAVCVGGRYDKLVETLDGEPTPAVGWAMGMERLMTLMPDIEEEKLDIFVVSNNMKETIKLANNFREKNLAVDFDLGNKKFAKQLEKASKLGAKFAVILGEDEIKGNFLTIKNLKTGMQEKFSFDEFVQKI